MNRLKELRKAKGLTQEEFAKVSGIAPRTIQRWESGETQIRTINIEFLKNFFDVTESYLLGYSDNPDEITLEDDEIIVDASLHEKYKQAYELLNGLRGFLNE